MRGKEGRTGTLCVGVEERLWSVTGGGARKGTTLEVVNETPWRVSLNWIRPDGSPGNERLIEAGSKHNECTYVGDAFLVSAVWGTEEKTRERVCAYRCEAPGRHSLKLEGERVRASATHRPVEACQAVEYTREVCAGFVCEIDRRLLDDHGESSALETFRSDLASAASKLPPEAASTLIELDTRVVVNKATRSDLISCCYHPGADWLVAQGLPARFEGCVHVYKLDRYCRDRGLWGPGGCLVHELAHAYHDKCLSAGHKNAQIARRFSLASPLYQSVRVKPDYRRAKHYACTDPAEFFAELSTAFLEETDAHYNKWEPFNRRDLRHFDPRTCDLLERVWLRADPLASFDHDDDSSDDDSDVSRDTGSCFRRRRVFGLAPRRVRCLRGGSWVATACGCTSRPCFASTPAATPPSGADVPAFDSNNPSIAPLGLDAATTWCAWCLLSPLFARRGGGASSSSLAASKKRGR